MIATYICFFNPNAVHRWIENNFEDHKFENSIEGASGVTKSD